MITTIIGLGILILLHEIGHFATAKAFGVQIEELSVGFGRRVLSREVNGIKYSLAVFPFGGFVRFNQQSLEGQRPVIKMLIAIAGPGTNFLLAFLIFSFIAFFGLPEPSSRIGQVVADMPAATAGIIAGDKVVSVNSTQVVLWDEMIARVNDVNGSPVRIVVERNGGAVFETIVSPVVRNGRALLGVRPSSDVVTTRRGFTESVAAGVDLTFKEVRNAFSSFYQLFTFHVSLDAVGGPISIVGEGASKSRSGLPSILLFFAFLSANLAVLNILPIPALDGGHVCFACFEQITRRPANQKIQGLFMKVSAVVFFGFIVIVSLNDIRRIFGG